MSARTFPTALPVLRETAAQFSEQDRARIAEDLRRLDVGEIRFDRHNQLLYSTDASLYQVEPIGVVVPAGTDAVARIVEYCAASHIAVLPRGGGTSLAGQCTNRALVVDLTPACRRVLSVDAAAMRCTVEPGISIDGLNRHLDSLGTRLFFAPDPATVAQASIGGCIGNNAAGARSIRYGRTSENLAGVDVVLSSGERTWLRPGAGRTSEIARRLAEQVAAVVRENADEIRSRFPNLIRRNAGYGLDLILTQLDRGVAPPDLDLSGLICGSEGTLAVVVGADLKLQPIPKARGLAVVSFNDLDAAIAAVVKILVTNPSAVELLDDAVLRAAGGNAECRPYVEMLPKVAGHSPLAALYVEYQTEKPGDELEGCFDHLRQVVPDAPIAIYRDADGMGRAWALRKASEALLHGLPGKAKPVTFVEDNSVPVEQLSRFVTEFRQIVERHGTDAAYYAHASVGVLHVRPMIDLHSREGREKMQAIAVEVADLARRCGGVMSGEHGDGRVRGPLLPALYGPQIMAAFKKIKTIFDPAGILNPGNIVDAGPIANITENLRVDGNSPAVDLSKVDTYYRYTGEEGFAGAVELCNGAGFCRKTAGGTMCPSYRATLDERHSTRGRANAIRLAVTGQTPAAGRAANPQWDDPAVLETLHLCLSCKACKTECPSNVDIAQLKSEYLAQRYRQQGGAPLATKIFGNVRLLNRLGSMTPGLANWFNGLPPVRAVINRVLNLAPQRSVPPFAPSLYRWFRKRDARAANRSLLPSSPGTPGKDRGGCFAPMAPLETSAPPPALPRSTGRGGKSAASADSERTPMARRLRVALWADCFVTYNEPHIGRAATAVLETLGYQVELPRGGCCARPQISIGLLDEAMQTADRTLASLKSVIDDPCIEAIIVLEPSCLSAIKDDWLKLNLKTDLQTRQSLAVKSMMLEEFIEQRWDIHPIKPVIRQSPQAKGARMILHGHCHQKALWGVESSAAVLRRIAGDQLDVLPSGCCGMAGSFGYTADRYDLSMKIGELSVFPPVRAAPSEAIIIAPGTSCRHQIKDGTGRCCLHPAEVLAMVLGSRDW